MEVDVSPVYGYSGVGVIIRTGYGRYSHNGFYHKHLTIHSIKIQGVNQSITF